MSYQFRPSGGSSVGDFVVVPDVSDIQNIFDGGGTVTAWIYVDDYGQLDFGRILDKDGSTIHGWIWFVSGPAAPGGVNQGFGFVQQFSSVDGEWETAASAILTGTWYHIAVTYDADSTANNPQFYIDGAAVTTTEISTPSGTRVSDAGARFLIGQRFAYDRGFEGRIADVRLYDRALPDAEIQTMHASRGSDNIVKSLLRRWPLRARPGLGPGASPYVDSIENTINGTSITLTVPSQVDGDTLIMVVCSSGINNSTPPNITTPSGWTLVAHEDADPTPPTWPVVGVYSRTASSEPASYAVSDDQTTHPWGGIIFNYGELTTTVDTQAVSKGTTASPVSPTVTPSGNAFVLRIAIMDDELKLPSIAGNFYPTDLAIGRFVLNGSDAGTNGYILGVGEELWDGTATGTRTWSGTASDQWAGLTIAFLHGKGRENDAAKDVSNAQASSKIWGRVVGGEDILRGC